MYERFTDESRKVFQLANQIAQKLNHEFIGTEHLLLGLIKENSGGIVVNILRSLEVSLNRLEDYILKIIQPGSDLIVMGRPPQTPKAKNVIQYAIESARELKHNYVGTENILLGLLREEGGIASQVLRESGLDYQKVKVEILRLANLKKENKEGNVKESMIDGLRKGKDDFGERMK